MIIRVGEAGKPAFQLRKGEEGVSVFDTDLASPEVSNDEVLSLLREGSALIIRSRTEIEAKGLTVEVIEGADFLPPRLRFAHAEIRPAAGMARGEFKQALKELE